jgi:molybdate transport system substrate-binding protein
MLNLFSAGACKGLFQARFAKQLESGALHAAFGAVGAMQARLLGGEACELIVLTMPMLEALAKDRWVAADTIRVIGAVGTGIAIPKNMPSVPNVRSTEVLRANLLAATSIHFPDPALATAGIHFQRVLQELGIADEVAANCHHYVNGAAAMAALGAHNPKLGELPIGCTQVSEILYTPSVQLVAELPEPLQLRTTYAVALTISGLESEDAHKILEQLTASATLPLRRAGGFIV